MSAHRLLDDLFIADFVGKDPGSAGEIKVERDRQVIPIVTAEAETRTVAAPLRAGVEFSIVMETDGGDVTITFPASINQAANTVVTMNDVQDFAKFVSVRLAAGTFKWRLIAENGTVLS